MGLLLNVAMYTQSIHNYMHGRAHRQSTYTQLSPLHLLSMLYVTHVIKHSTPSPTFLYFSCGIPVGLIPFISANVVVTPHKMNSKLNKF